MNPTERKLTRADYMMRTKQGVQGGDFTIVPNAVFTILKGEQLRFWLILWSQSGEFLISKKCIAQLCDCSEATTKRIIRELSKIGMLSVTISVAPTGRKYNSYKAVIPSSHA